MSGTLPTGKTPSEVTLKSDQPIIEDRSESGKRQSRLSAGHLWKIQFKYPMMDRQTFAPIYAFCAKQRGDSFQVVIPKHDTPQGAVTGSININGIAEVGSLVINIEGFVAGTAYVFKAGDIIKAANHSKVYMVSDDASAGANSDLLLEDGVSFLLLEDGTSHLMLELSGQAVVNLTSPIIEEITDGINITYNSVPFTASLDKDIMEWKTTVPGYSSFSFELTESIT